MTSPSELSPSNSLLSPEKLAEYKTNYLRHGRTLNESLVSDMIDEIERLRRREYVMAQHEETGRYWSGPREDIPPRFAEVPERAEGGPACAQPAASKELVAELLEALESIRQYANDTLSGRLLSLRCWPWR